MTSLVRFDSMKQLPEISHESVASLFDGKLGERILALPLEMTQMSQAEIESIRLPNETDYRLRERVLDLIDQAQSTGATKIKIVRIFEGIVTAPGWERVSSSDVRLAWIFKRPIDDKRKMQTHLQMMLQKCEKEIIPRIVTDENMGAFLKLLEFLTNRVHGPVVHRIESKNLNVDISGTKPSAEPASRNEIIEKIKELESSLNKTKVIDVTTE